MIKPYISFLLALGLSAFTIACDDDGPAEETGEEIDDAADDVGDAVDEAGESASDKLSGTAGDG